MCSLSLYTPTSRRSSLWQNWLTFGTLAVTLLPILLNKLKYRRLEAEAESTKYAT